MRFRSEWTGLRIYAALCAVVAGATCTEDVDECAGSHSPCRNGGTCINHRGGYRCICVNGWTGQDCSINIDDCAIGPCYNGGTCHDRVGYYFCQCPRGKTGNAAVVNSCSQCWYTLVFFFSQQRLILSQYPLVSLSSTAWWR